MAKPTNGKKATKAKPINARGNHHPHGLQRPADRIHCCELAFGARRHDGQNNETDER